MPALTYSSTRSASTWPRLGLKVSGAPRRRPTHPDLDCSSQGCGRAERQDGTACTQVYSQGGRWTSESCHCLAITHGLTHSPSGRRGHARAPTRAGYHLSNTLGQEDVRHIHDSMLAPSLTIFCPSAASRGPASRSTSPPHPHRKPTKRCSSGSSLKAPPSAAGSLTSTLMAPRKPIWARASRVASASARAGPPEDQGSRELPWPGPLGLHGARWLTLKGPSRCRE